MKTPSVMLRSGFSPVSLLLQLALLMTSPRCGLRVDAQPSVESAGSYARQLSTGAAAVVRLSEAGVDRQVVLAFVEAATTLFSLSAEDLIYVRDIGIDPAVIAAMIQRDTVLASNAPGLYAAQTSGFPAPPPALTNVAATTAEPVYVTNAPGQVVQFYSTLEPYGSWLQVEDLGWCWQPRIVLVDRAWRPYWQGGRWIYTDLGWYWQSDYTWGCVFHYGRWHPHPRCGWVWFPDPVWAPAWVSWRYSNAYCGWAPLPPRAHFVVGEGFRFNNVRVAIDFAFGLSFDLFTFVEIGHLHELHPHLYGVPRERSPEVFRQTTVVNNYIVGNNHRIINRGLPPDRYSAVTHRELRPVAVRDSGPLAHPIGRPDRIERAGSDPVLYRSEIKAEARAGAMRAQKIDERHPTMTPPAWRSEPAAPRHEPLRPAPAQPAPVTKRPFAVPSSPAPRKTIPAKPARSQPGSPTPSRVQPMPATPVRPQATPIPPAPGSTPLAPSVQPPSQPGRIPAPVVRTMPQPKPLPRAESPRGRDLRLSNGTIRPRPAPAAKINPTPAPPVSNRPTPPDRRPH